MFLKYKDPYDLAWTGLDIHKVAKFLKSPDVFNPFDDKLNIELDNRGLREIALMYDPNYIWYTAKLLLNIDLPPIQCVVLEQFLTHAFPMLCASRGFSKSFLMGVYALLRAILFQGSKIILTGAAFRQSKFIFDYIETIYNGSPVLQSIFKGSKPVSKLTDFWTFHVGESRIIATPTGTGEKIRGLRGSIIIADEFNSINMEVYEIVVSQFSVVSSSPVENIKAAARKLAMAKEGKVEEQFKPISLVSNQSIISGTMRYSFEPMAIYWKKYKEIIESRGKKMIEQFGDIGEGLDWKDFCILRLPIELVPDGFMDKKIIARSRTTMHADFYASEFGACPISDSVGFYKRSLIEACTAKPANVNSDNWPSWCADKFDARIRGNKGSFHVMGIDPAYNNDNFAIVILECFGEHARVVYGWSTSKRTLEKSGAVNEKNYFNFCTRKIRDLMKVFNIVGIAIDSQGGGHTILEALHDDIKLEPGEVPLWPVIDPEKEQITDDYPGNHCVTIVNFASADWTQNANHGMKKDMEDKVLLFPAFNSILLGLATEKDKEDLISKGQGATTDSLEDCMLEIEELKDELTMIIRTTTSIAGREHWDTPDIKISKNKKDRMRKDRYSALLMANSIARNIQRTPPQIEYKAIGIAVGENVVAKSGKMYDSEWYNVSPNLFRGITSNNKGL